MKKLILCAALVAALFTSCKKEVVVPQDEVVVTVLCLKCVVDYDYGIKKDKLTIVGQQTINLKIDRYTYGEEKGKLKTKIVLLEGSQITIKAVSDKGEIYNVTSRANYPVNNPWLNNIITW